MEPSKYFFIAAFIFGSSHQAFSEIILNPTQSGNAGFSVVSTAWSEQNANHADNSYRAFKKASQKEPGAYDFYYSLRIAPQYPASNKPWCKTGISPWSFLKSFVGISDAGLALLKVSLSYKFDAGGTIDYVAGDAPLIMVGTGKKTGEITPGNGCFFDVTRSQDTPLLRYGGGGSDQDLFQFKFFVTGGEAKSFNAISTVSSFFNAAAAAASMATFNPPAAALYDKATKKFEDALSDAGSFTGGTPANFEMKISDKPSQRVQISLPSLFGGKAPQGNLLIYIRRSSSIFLDTDQAKVTPADILSSQKLSFRGCGLNVLAKGRCLEAEPFSFVLPDLVKSVVQNLSSTIYDLKNDAVPPKVFALCKMVRTILRDKYRLTTIDEMYVRWALAKESGLLDTLNDKTALEALAKANGVTPEQIQAVCYNGGDEKILQAMDANKPR
jgi:hypothetical protein